MPSTVVGSCVGREVGWPLLTVTTPSDLAGASPGACANAAKGKASAVAPRQASAHGVRERFMKNSHSGMNGRAGRKARARECLRRGGSGQSAGGPRLKGSPGMAAPAFAGTSATATAVPAKHGTAASGSAGNTKAREPQRSQRMPVDASPSAESLPASEEAVLTLQMPPSLPVLTSCASMDTGAHNAAATARKLNQVARRAHIVSVGRVEGKCGTAEL